MNRGTEEGYTPRDLYCAKVISVIWSIKHHGVCLGREGSIHSYKFSLPLVFSSFRLNPSA